MTEYEKTLPAHWRSSKLGEVCNTTSGGTPSRKNPSFYEGNIPWVKSGELNYNIILETEEYISEEAIKKSSAKVFPKGTLLIALYGATIGKLGILGIDAATNQAVCAVFKNGIFESKFLYYLLFHRRQDLIKEGIGGAQPNISQTILKNLEIPICPLPEQRAIVSKIEQLFSELDNGISNLKLAQEQLKVYRQAVLKKAFEGELTKKWREQQTDLPDKQNLMKQIQREWEEAIRTSGKKTKAIKSLTEAELEELSLLPEGWMWVKLGQVVWSVKDGPHYSPKYEEKGIPFISGGNVRPSGVDFSNAKCISKELHEELSKRCKPELNDILYTKGGTTGIARVNTYDFDFDFWVHVAVLKTIKSIYPFYLQHVLNSSHCYRQSQKYTHGVGNQDLGLTRMILITLPICSLPEQQIIVQEIETRLSVCDKIEQDIETNLEKAEALRQSILKKAFEGKLLNEKELAEVRGAEDWELAGILLERIKAEKAGNGKKEKQPTEKLKSIIQNDKGIIQQATLQAFEQSDK